MLLFLFQKIRNSGAFGNPAGGSDGPRSGQQGLKQRGFSGAEVSDQSDVADVFGVVKCLFTSHFYPLFFVVLGDGVRLPVDLQYSKDSACRPPAIRPADRWRPINRPPDFKLLILTG